MVLGGRIGWAYRLAITINMLEFVFVVIAFVLMEYVDLFNGCASGSITINNLGLVPLFVIMPMIQGTTKGVMVVFSLWIGFHPLIGAVGQLVQGLLFLIAITEAMSPPNINRGRVDFVEWKFKPDGGIERIKSKSKLDISNERKVCPLCTAKGQFKKNLCPICEKFVKDANKYL
jgi:hypothetical protein